MFDKREAFGVGDPAGVGGVVSKAQRKAQKKTAISKCCVCDQRCVGVGVGVGVGVSVGVGVGVGVGVSLGASVSVGVVPNPIVG